MKYGSKMGGGKMKSAKYGSKMGGGKMKSASKSKGKGSVYGAIKVVRVH